MTVHLYTDASFDLSTGICACGYIGVVGQSPIFHSIVMYAGIKTSQEGELKAITEGLQHAFLTKGIKTIALKTDQEKFKLWSQGMNIRKAVMEKHKEYFEIVDIIKEYEVQLFVDHVKSHNGNPFNSKIDSSCRKHLRKYLKENFNCIQQK